MVRLLPLLVVLLSVASAKAQTQTELAQACALAAKRPFGRIDKIDPQAASACQAALAADPENPRLLFEAGHVAQSNKDDNQARAFYEKAAALGHAGAQNNLALFYVEGRGGLTKNDEEAVRLFKLAAARGDANAQAGLGLFYETGRGGLTKDEQEAMRLFKLAAAHGSTWAQARLGGSYATGGGPVPEWITALRTHLTRYWRLPPGVDANSKLRVSIRVVLNPDGSLSQPPTILEGPPSPEGVAFAESAVKALDSAQPFTMLKAENYGQWKEMILDFDSTMLAKP